jgi:hypothetical protein
MALAGAPSPGIIAILYVLLLTIFMMDYKNKSLIYNVKTELGFDRFYSLCAS